MAHVSAATISLTKQGHPRSSHPTQGSCHESGCCIQAREGAVQQSANEASEAAARAEEDHAEERMRLGQALADMTKQAELVRALCLRAPGPAGMLLAASST